MDSVPITGDCLAENIRDQRERYFKKEGLGTRSLLACERRI